MVNVRREVLLVEYVDETPDGSGEAAGRAYWVPPGGGVRPGESFEHAAARELAEETGIVVSGRDLGPPVLSRRCSFVYRGTRIEQDERCFLLPHTPGPNEVLRNHTPDEPITAIRWWPLAVLRETNETIFPEDLFTILTSVLIDNHSAPTHDSDV